MDHKLVIIIGIITLFASSTLASAQEDGFVSLFNGKNLEGWIIEKGSDEAFQVEKGAIHTMAKDGYPCWLRSDKTYENYDLRFDFMVKGWVSSGLFFNAPLHGRQSKAGFEFKIYHDTSKLTTNTCGAIFDVIPPTSAEIKGKNQWNSARIMMDWPSLKIWLNDVLIQDIDINEHNELKYRLRRGYIGLQDVGYHTWFKNLRIKELSNKEEWITLFNGNDFAGWYEEGKGVKWSVRDGAIHSEDNGAYMVTNEVFEDFDLFCYVRTDKNANGGIFYRWNTLKGGDRGYEVQIENVPDSPHPTGSLYNVVRGTQPRYEIGEWFPMQIRVEGTHIVIRVNGETTVDYDNLKLIRPGHIALQMHHWGKWVDWKDIRIKKFK